MLPGMWPTYSSSGLVRTSTSLAPAFISACASEGSRARAYVSPIFRARSAALFLMSSICCRIIVRETSKCPWTVRRGRVKCPGFGGDIRHGNCSPPTYLLHLLAIPTKPGEPQMAMTPDDVLKLIKDKEVKFV